MLTRYISNIPHSEQNCSSVQNSLMEVYVGSDQDSSNLFDEESSNIDQCQSKSKEEISFFL